MPLTAFVEERLELGIVYGTEGGPGFRTTVVESISGYEERNAEWDYEKGEWTLGGHRVTRATYNYVKRFFRARRGMAVGFRWKNLADYVLAKTVIGTGNGATATFQIVQVADTGYGDLYSRPIRKPVGGTVTVYLDDAVQSSGVTVDTTTGEITFDTPPVLDAVIAVQCEFDIPVRFGVDRLDGALMAYRLATDEMHYEITALPIVEDLRA